MSSEARSLVERAAVQITLSREEGDPPAVGAEPDRPAGAGPRADIVLEAAGGEEQSGDRPAVASGSPHHSEA